MSDCLFCRIVRKELPAGIVYEDDRVLAFNDIAPQAPVHILVIPKEHIPCLSALKDFSVLPALFRVAAQLAADKGIQAGFRTVFNNGRGAGMAVDHLHLHLRGGRDLSWPPG
jgi:histidine triad (HIT) family protein